jgi:ADP-ribose pyrophosphatase
MYDIDAVTLRKAAEKMSGEGTQVSHPIYIADDHILVNITPRHSRSFRSKFYFKSGSFDHKDPIKENTMQSPLFTGKWLTMYAENGYEYFHRHRKPQAVMIVAITENNELVLAIQKRTPHEKMSVEIPAGLVDEGETHAKTAVRELWEECGYVGDEPIITRECSTTPGICTETIPFAIMLNCKKLSAGGGLPSENEVIIPELLNMNQSILEIRAEINHRFPKEKYLTDMKLYAGILIALTHSHIQE